MLEKTEMVIVAVLIILILMGSKKVQSATKSLRLSLKSHHNKSA
jgi:Sec-independent protein translocase protein TatA